MKVSNYARPGSAALNAPSTPGGTGGGIGSVTDGTHTVSPATELDFTSGATVTDLGDGIAGVAVTGGISGIEVKETDGTPDVTGVTVVQVPPGGLTDNTGGNVTLEVIPNRGPIERVHVEAAVGATYTLDWSVAATQDLTLTTGCTVSFSNVPFVSGFLAAQAAIIRGNQATTWPGAVTWQNGLAPWASSAALLVVFTSEDGGTTVGGTVVGFVNEAGIVLSNVTTNDVSISKHGFAPKAPNDATKYLDGTGAWSAPPGSGTGSASDHEHVMDVLFSGDGSTVAFALPAAPFDAYSVAAYVAGVLTEVTLSGALLDTATFGSAPGAATDNVRFDIVAAVV